MTSRLLAVLAIGFAADPRPAAACTPAKNGRHELDPRHAADRTPPSIPTVAAGSVRRSDGTGCADCGDLASIDIQVSATDDAAPPTELGYQVRVVGGTPPAGLDLEAWGPHGAQPYGPTLILGFDYDAAAFTVDLEVRAVDLNGNVGPPTTVTVSGESGDTGGCASTVSRQTPWATLALAMLVLGLTISKRRRC